MATISIAGHFGNPIPDCLRQIGRQSKCFEQLLIGPECLKSTPPSAVSVWRAIAWLSTRPELRRRFRDCHVRVQRAALVG
jgi:hypothetical protein